MGNTLPATFLPSKKSAEHTLAQKDFSRNAMRATQAGDVQTLQKLMKVPSSEGGLPLASVKDEASGQTLLHVAMEHDRSECVKLLLSAGCDVSAEDGSRETPLHVVSMHDSVQGFEALLDSGCDINLESRDMWKRTPLLKSVVYRSDRIFQMLLALQADYNAQDVYGLSLIHIAASYGRVDIIQRLAEKGANLNLLNNKLCPPLSVAITIRRPDVVAKLIQLGASTDFPGSRCAVATAAKGLIQRIEGGTVCENAERVLHLVLAAHGYPLHTDEPDVFSRILLTADTKRFLPILCKMHICSDCQYSFQYIWSSDPSSPTRGGKSPLTLLDLARRTVRKGLMASGRNVVWACEKLPEKVPPAAKGILLLEDCDYKDVQLP